jgi:hypothetical protein
MITRPLPAADATISGTPPGRPSSENREYYPVYRAMRRLQWETNGPRA